MAFCNFVQGAMNAICLWIFFKLYEAVDMDGSFPMSRSI
jgi:hypothetical protein